MKAGSKTEPTCYEYKSLDWITTAVVQNIWQTPLATTSYPVKLYYVTIEQTNNGATNENIVLELTLNGTAKTLTITGAVSGTIYYAVFDMSGNITFSTSARQLLSQDLDQSAPLETKSLQVRTRQTSGVDPVSAQIEVNAIYGEAE